MCCRKNANRRTHQALPSKASPQPNNSMSLGAIPSENLPYRPNATNVAGVSPVIVGSARQSHCCRRRCRRPLIWRLGKLIYSRAQEKYHEHQIGRAQEQSYIDSTSADLDPQAYYSMLMMPPDYDEATRAPEIEKEGVWLDEKRV